MEGAESRMQQPASRVHLGRKLITSRSASRMASLYAIGTATWMIISDVAVSAWLPIQMHAAVAPWLEALFLVVTTVLVYAAADLSLQRTEFIRQRLSEAKTQYRQMFERSPAPMFVFDRRTMGLLAANDAALELYGYRREAFLKLTVADIRPPEDVPRLLQMLRDPDSTEQHHGQARHLRSDGTVINVEINSSALSFEGRDARLVMVQDQTECRRAERHAALISGAFDFSHEVMMLTDPKGQLVAVNHSFCRTTGYGAEEVLGKTPRVLQSGYHDAAFYATMRTSLAEAGRWEGEIWNRRKDGSCYPCWLRILEVRDARGELMTYLGIGSDLSERKKSEQRIRELAFYDPLTDLPNRPLLEDRLRQDLASCTAAQRNMAVMFFNIDRFKLVNDSMGHAAGDELLRGIAGRLRERLRPQDTVGRWAGDNFVLLLPDVDQALAASMASELLVATSQPIELEGQSMQPSASVGIALYPQDGEDSAALLRNADAALHSAKQTGAGQLRFYGADMNRSAIEQIQIAAALRKALETQELELFFQPQFDLHSGRLTGAEALMRWNSARLGRVGPDRFIPVAEATGQIVAMGAWALREACAQAMRWSAEDDNEAPRVAVNLSSVQFSEGDLPDQVATVLADTGLPPGRLELEVTETTLLQSSDSVMQQFQRLRALGVRIALDDFGTGYSSLSYVQRYDMDVLKIDQAFVRHLHEQPQLEAICRAIVAMGHGLGLEVVAEGIEDEAIRQTLLSMGCDTGQGFGLARPMPAGDFVSWLKQRRDRQRPRASA